MKGVSEILISLSEAPPGQHAQIDEQICVRLRKLAIAPTADEMKRILDECAFGGLASDFAMVAMDVVWRMLLSAEGAK